MKKLFETFIVLLLVYFILSVIAVRINHGYEIDYSIFRKKVDVTINEKYEKNIKGEINHYDFIITVGKDKFKYRLLEDNNYTKLIEDVYYESDDNYVCILPVFKNNTIKTDIMCKAKNGVYYNYSSISAPSKKLIKFANSISIYEKRNYQDKLGKITDQDLTHIYSNNLMNDFVFALTNYKGLYILGDEIKNIKLFKDDAYTRDLSTFTTRYYVTADYSQKYDFNSLYLIDLKNNSKHKIKLKNSLPQDSYIAGVIDDDVYIIDKSNIKEYKLNAKNKTIKEIGNENSGMLFYNNGTWDTVPWARMTLKNTYFKNVKEENSGKYHLFLTNSKLKSGYSYYYKKNGKNYEIYKEVCNSDEMMYLFTTTDISKMKSASSYLFYQEDDKIKYYSDKTGIRTVLENSELHFNKDILYGVYYK